MSFVKGTQSRGLKLLVWVKAGQQLATFVASDNFAVAIVTLVKR